MVLQRNLESPIWGSGIDSWSPLHRGSVFHHLVALHVWHQVEILSAPSSSGSKSSARFREQEPAGGARRKPGPVSRPLRCILEDLTNGVAIHFTIQYASLSRFASALNRPERSEGAHGKLRAGARSTETGSRTVTAIVRPPSCTPPSPQATERACPALLLRIPEGRSYPQVTVVGSDFQLRILCRCEFMPHLDEGALWVRATLPSRP
jgi:hypothetical protein